MTDKSYRFDASNDENSWEAVHRLMSEAGWKIAIDDESIAKLRAHSSDRNVSRALMTRAQFVSALIRDAGAKGAVIYAPLEEA